MGNGIAGFSVPDWRDIREIRINQYSNQYVSEALKGEFTGWFMDNIPAVFISSPTGSGKNFFIEQCIIPFVNICHGNIGTYKKGSAAVWFYLLIKMAEFMLRSFRSAIKVFMHIAGL